MPSKSRLGQNFLHDPQAIEHIAAALGSCAHRTVIEIGPGRGAITRAIAHRLDSAPESHLIAVELDPRLAEDLRIEFLARSLGSPSATALATPSTVAIVQESILHFDLHAAAAQAAAPLIIVGNLPYYITSEILFYLAAHHTALDRAILMVQREVADRVTAQPGSSDYGILSATLQLYGNVERLFTLPPSAFTPPPEVHSTVFRWHFAPRFTSLGVDEAPFIAFLRRCFAQKRKTLNNNLRHADFTTAQIDSAFASTQTPPQARAETLSLEAFAALWRALQN